MRKEYRELDNTVYPSTEKTLSVIKDDDYNGAHVYYAKNCTIVDNKVVYIGTEQQIRFVKKLADDTVIPGLQSEQLVHILLDRHVNLNRRFPSDSNANMVAALEMFLQACKERVDERTSRGVMGKLEK